MNTVKGSNVTFFANTRLKSKQITNSKGIKTVYPLYATLIYDQSNTHLKVDTGGGTYMVSEDLEEIAEGPLRDELEMFKDRILNIIKHEEEFFGEDYALTGFGRRLKLYDSDAIAFMLDVPLSRFVKSLSNTIGSSSVSKSSYSGVLEAILFISGVHVTTSIFDWKFNDGKAKVDRLLRDLIKDAKQREEILRVFDYCITYDLFRNIKTDLVRGNII